MPFFLLRLMESRRRESSMALLCFHIAFCMAFMERVSSGLYFSALFSVSLSAFSAEESLTEFWAVESRESVFSSKESFVESEICGSTLSFRSFVTSFKLTVESLLIFFSNTAVILFFNVSSSATFLLSFPLFGDKRDVCTQPVATKNMATKIMKDDIDCFLINIFVSIYCRKVCFGGV